jgi:hypothetical protein
MAAAMEIKHRMIVAAIRRAASGLIEIFGGKRVHKAEGLPFSIALFKRYCP